MARVRPTSLLAFVLIALAALPAAALAADAAGKVDTSHWQCRFCPFPSGWKGHVRAGPGYVSNDSAKFGEYSDLDSEGLFLSLDSDVTYYGEDGRRWDVTARDLGLESRYLELSGGTQGSYKVTLQYDEIVHHASDSAVTPFVGAGGDSLALPANWKRAQTTGEMSALDGDLHSVGIGTRRQRVGVGLDIPDAGHWDYSVNVTHEHRDGSKVTGASFLNTSTLLPEPVDYDTDQLTAQAGYTTDKWQLRFSYLGSFFSNANDSLTWDNPFTAVTEGADTGRLSLAPDNQFHQVSVSGSYKFGQRASFAGDVALGRMLQDQNFGAASANPRFAGVALPRNSPGAEVNTLTANGRLVVVPPVPRLSLTWDYHIDRHNNDTPTDTYQQVVADSFLGVARTNEPLSYARYTSGLRADYHLPSRRRLAGGLDYTYYERDYGADPRTQEYTGWAEFRTPLGETASFRLKASHGVRNGTGQGSDSPAVSQQNPLMTWYGIADRTRDNVRAGVDFSPLDWMTVSLIGERTWQDYGNTEVGRTDSREESYTVEASATPWEKSSVYAYITRERYATRQYNSQSYASPDWRGDTRDSFYTGGIGSQVKGIADKFALGVDLSYTRSLGATEISTAPADAGFPDYRARRFTARLQGEYQRTDNLSLGITVIYEHFTSKDWQLDGVAPDTVPHLLALGEQSPDYDVVVTVLTADYRF